MAQAHARFATTHARAIVFGFVALFAGVFGSLSGAAAYGMYQQARSVDFAQTTGRIARSELETRTSSRGRTHHTLRLTYSYTVSGRGFTGDRRRFELFDLGHARSAARRYPTGQGVPVYYDPARPALSLLEPGITNSDRFLALFLAPFDLVGLAMVAGLLWSARPVRGDALTGGLRADEHPEGVRVRLPWTPAALAALLAAGGGSFVALGAVALVLDGPSTLSGDRLGAIGWAVGGLAGSVLVVKLLANRSPRGDLLLDTLRRVMRFHGGGKAREVRFEQVEGFGVQTANGGMAHFLRLRWRDADGDERNIKATQLPRRERAEALAAWLNERVGATPEAATAAR